MLQKKLFTWKKIINGVQHQWQYLVWCERRSFICYFNFRILLCMPVCIVYHNIPLPINLKEDKFWFCIRNPPYPHKVWGSKRNMVWIPKRKYGIVVTDYTEHPVSEQNKTTKNKQTKKAEQSVSHLPWVSRKPEEIVLYKRVVVKMISPDQAWR